VVGIDLLNIFSTSSVTIIIFYENVSAASGAAAETARWRAVSAAGVLCIGASQTAAADTT
jgi:hypothetical protein